VPADVLRQVRADLDELGRIIGAPAPASLYDLLGVPPGAGKADLRRVRDELAARNRQRRPDRRRALIDDLLAAVITLLLDGDPEAYLDALAVAATERLRPRVAAAVLVEDQLLPAQHAAFVGEPYPPAATRRAHAPSSMRSPASTASNHRSHRSHRRRVPTRPTSPVSTSVPPPVPRVRHLRLPPRRPGRVCGCAAGRRRAGGRR
jgi:hypothetical protein